MRYTPEHLGDIPIGPDTSPASTRSHKRVRRSVTSQETVPVLGEPAFPRVRGPSACERCRSRKTKCDNKRPSCGYCLKRQLPCVYTDDAGPSSWSSSATQILTAIGDLSTLIQRQQQLCSSCSQQFSQDGRPYTWRPIDPTHTDSRSPNPSGHGVRTDDPPSDSSQPPPRSQGMESILEWDILTPFQPTASLFSSDPLSHVLINSMPTTDITVLSRLARKYIDGVHLKNPILDVPQLHALISGVAENGFDWSLGTCLVTLVCAIGATSQQYQDHHLSPDNRPTPGAPSLSTSGAEEVELSIQFWSLASKRLGMAMGQDNIQSVQCLCLAGIWYMHQMQPLQAWKHFNLAGAAWHAVHLAQHPYTGPFEGFDSHPDSFTVFQALYFTIWKSEWELRLELPVPKPILDSVGFPHAFPLPPIFGDDLIDREATERERGWYYYLAEIAARHLVNRLINVDSWTSHPPSNADVRRLLAQADMIEAQIHQWYSSLPPTFFFDIPTGDMTYPLEDDLTQILRHRYLTCRELVARPFVKLCVESPLAIEPDLRDRVVSFAAQGLQYCMLKLSQVAPHRHQGTWFMLRNTASASLVLSAVKLIQQAPSLSRAQELGLPHGWKARISEAVVTIGEYWNEPRGGLSQIRLTLDAVLAACD